MTKRNEPRRCLECGKAMRNKMLKHYLYEGAGVPVMLQDVTRWKCSNGHEEIGIPRMAGLHKAIARLVASRRRLLEPNEVRFLRKHLGFTSKDFALEMGVDPVTVSKWERGHQPIGQQSQKLLQLMALTRPLSRYLSRCKGTAPDVLELTTLEGKWTVAA